MDRENEKATIMVVDDIPANLNYLKEMLQAKGYKVITFSSGAMALEAAAKNNPDLILLDIMMPGMDGFEVCRRFKADDSLKDIPVIFISALDDTEEKVKAFSAGGVDYLTRPFQIEEIRARVETHIKIRSLQRCLQSQNENLELQFRQTRKMEAIGLLAGGVAHDFNNLLTIILGYSRILLTRMQEGSPEKIYISEIQHAGERAASLTRQLLAFSRKQIFELKVLNLNEIVQNIVKMLKRLIGENIVLTTDLFPTLNKIKADPGQIEQVLINLAVNARDAMPEGGHLTIKTEDIEIDNDFCDFHPGSKPGKYVMISISDTGIGIKPDVLNRIFEPFFTTKETGKGTGLGLSMVFGIIKQSEGYIDVNSEVGVGTCFTIYLPSVKENPVSKQSDETIGKEGYGNETILLVEDDESVRKMTKLALQIKGYNIIEACNGNQGIAVANNFKSKIHLLLTDIVMPEMNGNLLANALCASYPGLKVLFMSGYTDDEIMRRCITESSIEFIQKPFLPEMIAKKVREVLDSKSSIK